MKRPVVDVPWERRWIPLAAETTGSWTDGDGWAWEGPWIERMEDAGGPRRLVDLQEPLVFLVAEAGAGKSNELNRLAQAPGGHRVDLGTNWSVIQAALEHAGSPMLCDGLDDAADPAGTLRNLIQHLGNREREGKSMPAMRITCRASRWPDLVARARQLSEIAGVGAIAAWTLLPLQRPQAMEGLQVWSGSGRDAAKARVDGWTKAGLVGIARWPLGLRLLCEAGDETPRTRRELFEKVLPRLASPSPDEGRGRVAVPTRIRIAERIAVASVLTGKATMGDDGDALPLHEFASPAWGPDDEGCRVTEGEVQETVRDSTLFTSRTQGREFEHGEWRAFLAARHLCALPLEPEALLRLLGPADGQPGEIVGHLAPIASWLVDLKPELARGIAEHDPLMLLTAPHPALGAEERALLAETGVNAFTGGWKLSDIGAMQGLANLAHPALTEKLRSLLRVDATPHLQGMACVIARSCPDQAPLDALLTLALHPQADPQSRAWAASLTARLGGEPERHKLVPLCGSDVPEPARTAAVLALWPKHVGTRALLDALSTGVGLIGCLTLARGRIGKDLPAEDMPNAFAWASDALENLPVFATELWVAQAIFRRALVGAEIPQKDIRAAVLPWLGGTAGSIARWESVDWEFWADEEERAFVDALIDAACSLGAPDSGLDTVIDAWGALEGRGLFDRQVGWLVERIAVATDGPERAWLQVAASAALVHLHEDRNASGPTRPSVERRWQAVQKLASDPRARLALGDLLDPGWVPPRSHGPSRAGSDAGLAPDERGNDPWVERIRELLPVEASGGWPEIAWLLQTRPEGRSVELACVDDIPKRPLWRSLRATMQRELRALAASWLRTTTPPQVLDPRFGPTREEGPALWAFGLLASPEAGSGPGASAETLGRWAGVLLRARIPTGREGSLAHVVREAAQIALPQVLAALEDALAGPTFVVLPALDRLELALKLPDVADAVADVAGSLLREGRLQEVHEVFRRLLQAGSGRARDLGIEFMGEHGEGADALDVAAALVEYEPVAAWSVLRERFRDDDRARLMFRRVPAFTARWEWSPRHPIPSSLLGEAFSWLTRLHPYDKGKPRSGVQNGDYVVRMWRDAVIGELRRRTDPDALVAARSLVKAFPQVAFLALVRDEVQRASRDARWRPLSLDEVRRLGRRPPIRDAQELRVAVRAALDEAASALRDKPQPKAEALWNEDRPKPEQALSAWLVAFLRNQAAPGHLPGATVSYDAEQAKPSPVRKGERPDITVQVPLSAGRPPLTCLIEVKPSWADVVGELPVKARYQARTRDTTTIYLVFWFDPAQWNPDRGRKRARNWTSPEALRASLEERAKKLPEDRPVEVVVLDASR